jgi:hypothetical protein
MIWTAARNTDQGLLVASMYQRAGGVPCEREAVMADGLRGASALSQADVDPSRYLTISIDWVLEEMAAHDLISRIAGLSPLEGADLAHSEASSWPSASDSALADGLGGPSFCRTDTDSAH